MQTVKKENRTNAVRKTIYVGLNDNQFASSNGYLAIDNTTRRVDLSLFEMEKYRNCPLNLIPGTLKHVEISKTMEDLAKDQTIIKLILDANFQVISSEYIGEDGEGIENILIDSLDEKVSGIYPGAFKEYQKDFMKLSEANIFILVNQAIRKLEDINFHQSTNQEEKLQWEYAFDFCLAHLARFGVEQHFDFKTKRMEETKTFKAWYQWWYEYFESIMNDPELSCLLYDMQKTCQSLDMFRPSGSFDSYLDKTLEIKQEQRKARVKKQSYAKVKVS